MDINEELAEIIRQIQEARKEFEQLEMRMAQREKENGTDWLFRAHEAPRCWHDRARKIRSHA